MSGCTCPDGPTPRILESNGRLFCAVCRRYLAPPPEAPGPRSDEDTDGASNDAPEEKGDS